MDSTIFDNFFVAVGVVYMMWIMLVGATWLALFLIKGLARIMFN